MINQLIAIARIPSRESNQERKKNIKNRDRSFGERFSILYTMQKGRLYVRAARRGSYERPQSGRFHVGANSYAGCDEPTSGDSSLDDQANEQPQSPIVEARDTTSVPGTAKIDPPAAKKKQVARKRKTEAEKLQPFAWDRRFSLHPPNNELLKVPRARYQPQSGGSDDSSGEEITEPQSPVKQIAAFTGAVAAADAAAAPGAPSNGHVSNPNATIASGEEDLLEIDMDAEHHLAKLQRVELRSKERLKKRERAQGKKSPSTTRGGDVVAPKRKQQQITTQNAKTDGAGSGLSKVVASAQVQAAAPAAVLITPAPAAAPPAPPSVTKSMVPPNRPKAAPTARKSVNPQNFHVRSLAPHMKPPQVASAAAAAPTSEPQSIPFISPPPDLAPTPINTTNTPGALARIVMDHVLPLSSRMPPGTVGAYLSLFAKMTQEDKEQHAVFVTGLAQVGCSAELEAFVQRHSQ